MELFQQCTPVLIDVACILVKQRQPVLKVDFSGGANETSEDAMSFGRTEIQIILMAQALNFIKSGHNPIHIIFSCLSVIYQFCRVVAGIFYPGLQVNGQAPAISI